MHICYFGWADQIHMRRWAQCFATRGYKVSLVTTKRSYCHIDGLDVIPLKYSDSYWRMLWEVKKITKRIKPDIVHAHYISAFGFRALVSGIRPVVQTVWGSDIYNYPYKNASANKKIVKVVCKSEVITCDSMDLKNKIVKMGAQEEKVKIIQWGIDRTLCNERIDVSGVKEKLGLAGKNIIFSPRHFDPIYNIDIIIRAIPIIIEKNPDAFFILKDYTGALEKELKKLAEELGVTKYILFIGPCAYEELIQYYRIADIFVSVPSSDGTPVSLLEAMATGVAPIVSDLASVREWITDHVNGRIVPIRDANALAEAIIDVLADEHTRSTMTARNLELVARRGDHKKNMDIMEALYLEVSSQKMG